MSKFPTKKISTEKRAKSIEEAVVLALSELYVTREDAEIEIVQEPAKGFLGIGGKDAVVKVTAEVCLNSEVKEEDTLVEAPKPKKTKTSGGVYNSEFPEENAKNFITDILNAMGLSATVEAKLEGDMVNVTLEGENMGVVIGKRGDTLDSIQYLTSLVVNQNSADYIKVSIDTENYRQKREETVIALAQRLAAKVARTGRKFALEPMNPYERRIIHASLQNNEEVTTFSVGQEPYRKVVIAPKNPRPANKHNNNRKNYHKPDAAPVKAAACDDTDNTSDTLTYKADFVPQQHKAEYKNFEEYLAAHSKD